jgi:diacylglycerol kinase family enzyme
MGGLARVVLIVNPYSTEVTPGRLDAVSATLGRSCELVVWETERRGHAQELAAAAVSEADAVVVFAGDGTYNEAINGAGGQVPFGFVPGGGASVFPRALGLPRDPVAAAQRIVDALRHDRSTSIALGRVNGRRFCFSAGIGLDADVVRLVDGRGRDTKGRRAGTVAFATSALQELRGAGFHIRPQLEIEGFGRAAMLVVLNGHPYTFVGRIPLQLTNAADFSAGLDFVAPREITPRVIPPLALGLLRGTLAGDRRTLSGHDLSILAVRCDRPLAVQADGEDLGDLGEVFFESEPDALRVLL